MRKIIHRISPLTRSLAIAAAVTLSSQLYFNVYSDGFRISAAVIILPVLLMTLGEDISTVAICNWTAGCVLVFRSLLLYASTGSLAGCMELYFPNAVFYITYGIIFSLLCPNKFTVSYSRMLWVVLASDYLSNIVELCVNPSRLDYDSTARVLVLLFGVACIRGFISWVVLIGEKQYRTLLQKEEHEQRYQRLFLMTTGLKSEIFFMRKNSEEIERVMGHAYKMYEQLSSMDNVSDELKKTSLAIAKDVHEIKKDYIRIIKGIENEISEEYDEKRMKFSDILHILQESTQHVLASRKLKITLDFRHSEDFSTGEHYEIMSILKNMVNNAIEAIENAGKGDTISINQYFSDGNCIFTVTDNGPGISPRHLKNIFKMGYSTKFDIQTGNIYRGVGLCGVKATVEEKFGGSINVESELGNGTAFTVIIPYHAIRA